MLLTITLCLSFSVLPFVDTTNLFAVAIFIFLEQINQSDELMVEFKTRKKMVYAQLPDDNMMFVKSSSNKL